MRRATLLLLLAALLPACAAQTVPPPQPAPATAPPAAVASQAADRIEVGEARIRAATVQQRIAYLASDELAGRDTPSPGLEAAAAFLVRHFQELGLRPAGDQGGFIQRYPYARPELDRGQTTLRLQGRRGAPTLAFGSDFFVLGGRTPEAAGAVVFAGSAPHALAVDASVRGRAALFYLPGEPGIAMGDAAAAALRAGATAIGFILDPKMDAAAVAAWTDQAAEIPAGAIAPFPVFALRYEHAERLFRDAGLGLDTLVARPRTRPLPLTGTTVALRAPIARVQHRVPNVVALLPGSDPSLRNEYIVFSAHFDHVGIGHPDQRGDTIYNGADDNASGTAAVMALAEAFASLPTPPARSLVFLMISGEEKGLLGSNHWVENPTVPLGRVVANINLDMIGRNAPDTVVAIGQEYSTLGPLVQEVARARPELGLIVAPDLWPQEQLFFRSDQFHFARKDIPVLFFTTGLHDDYHRPSDTAERIDADKVARIARLVYHLGLEIGNRPERPAWTDAGRAAMRMMIR
jgi:hypothetical protein